MPDLKWLRQGLRKVGGDGLRKVRARLNEPSTYLQDMALRPTKAGLLDLALAASTGDGGGFDDLMNRSRDAMKYTRSVFGMPSREVRAILPESQHGHFGDALDVRVAVDPALEGTSVRGRTRIYGDALFEDGTSKKSVGISLRPDADKETLYHELIHALRARKGRPMGNPEEWETVGDKVKNWNEYINSPWEVSANKGGKYWSQK